MKTDIQIQQEVMQEIEWDTRVKATDVGVIVDRGVVTLTGAVSSYAERLAAKEAAHRVAGVLDVANDLQVRVPGLLLRSDSEIAHAVRQALEWDVLVPHERIQTTVTDGWVTLEGAVSTAHEREDSERAVRHLAGVRGVSNEVLVLPPAAEATRVREQIEEALERRAERTARRIDVDVNDDGVVTLTGGVRSYLEKQAILGAARFTPGVRSVEDRLSVDASA